MGPLELYPPTIDTSELPALRHKSTVLTQQHSLHVQRATCCVTSGKVGGKGDLNAIDEPALQAIGLASKNLLFSRPLWMRANST